MRLIIQKSLECEWTVWKCDGKMLTWRSNHKFFFVLLGTAPSIRLKIIRSEMKVRYKTLSLDHNGLTRVLLRLHTSDTLCCQVLREASGENIWGVWQGHHPATLSSWSLFRSLTKILRPYKLYRCSLTAEPHFLNSKNINRGINVKLIQSTWVFKQRVSKKQKALCQ